MAVQLLAQPDALRCVTRLACASRAPLLVRGLALRWAYMKTALLVLTTSLVGVAWADGLPLKNGRYPGEVLVFTLTAEQVQVIEHYRTCQFERSQAMNSYTPYVFKLTASQAEALRSKKGFTPDLFQVYETYLGFNDAGPHWNLILRFSEKEFEVPLDLVIRNAEAKAAHREQGWKTPNPCFPELTKP